MRFLLEKITDEFAIREIARQTKIDYKLVHSTIQKLVQKNILIKKRQANVDLCSLNLKADLTTTYYVEMLRTKEFLDDHSEMKTFFTNVLKNLKTLYYTLIVFGSFAKGKETRTSDLDVIIIAPTRAIGEEVERMMSHESLFLKRKMQTVVLDEVEFVENLASKKLNVVVEAFKNHIIIAGMEGFYNGVKQAL